MCGRLECWTCKDAVDATSSILLLQLPTVPSPPHLLFSPHRVIIHYHPSAINILILFDRFLELVRADCISQ